MAKIDKSRITIHTAITGITTERIKDFMILFTMQPALNSDLVLKPRWDLVALNFFANDFGCTYKVTSQKIEKWIGLQRTQFFDSKFVILNMPKTNP